jgi:hypothetical protein
MVAGDARQARDDVAARDRSFSRGPKNREKATGGHPSATTRSAS